jgi:hypothetical protein
MDLRSLSISRCRVRASFFDSFSKLPSSTSVLQILEALDGQLERLEVGHHAAQPAVIDIGHAATLGFLGDDLARLALGADEQDGALLGRHLADESHRLLVLGQGLFEVDDVDLVAMAENERGHLGVPETGLVAEMNAGLQHLAHGSTHRYLRYGLNLRPAVLLRAAAKATLSAPGVWILSGTTPDQCKRAIIAARAQGVHRNSPVREDPRTSRALPRSRLKCELLDFCCSYYYPAFVGNMPPASMAISIKTAEEIAEMRHLACRLAGLFRSPRLHRALRQARHHHRATRQTLPRLHGRRRSPQGCIPAPLNYAPPGYAPYPKSICASVNHQVCHGVPNDRALKKGDIVNLDITTIKDGWHGDTSRTFCVGETSILARGWSP